MFVVYEDGVYRHRTIAFGSTFESILTGVEEYFKCSDDYHCLTVEFLNVENNQVEEICKFTQKLSQKRVYNYRDNGTRWETFVTKGWCIIFKNEEEYLTYYREDTLREHQEWAKDK